MSGKLLCPTELRDEHLRDAILVRCRAERIEQPGRVDRIVRAPRASSEKRFCELIASRLDGRCIARLGGLIEGRCMT
jgi:hypothetical protein